VVVGLAVAALLLIRSIPADAQNFGPNPNQYNQYGNATNGYTGTMGYNANGGFCGATAIANSLQFLANKYGGIYNNLMQPATQTLTAAQTTRDAIVNLETIGTDGNGPTNQATQWNSKVSYIDSRVNPNAISIEGMENGAVFGSTGYNSASNTNLNLSAGPSETWLQQQVEAGQDVELGFTFTVTEPNNEGISETNTFAHMITLANIDSTGMYIQYLDPNNPGAFITAAPTISSSTGTTV
jgi:hypothetical protein